jgi:hypothetical protein
MRKTWRGVECLPPQDDELKLVISTTNITTIARYIDDLWIDEYTNRLIEVQFWMPIPIPPNE